MLEKLCTPALGTQMKEWERSISATEKKRKKKTVESTQVFSNSITIKTLRHCLTVKYFVAEKRVNYKLYAKTKLNFKNIMLTKKSKWISAIQDGWVLEICCATFACG